MLKKQNNFKEFFIDNLNYTSFEERTINYNDIRKTILSKGYLFKNIYVYQNNFSFFYQRITYDPACITVSRFNYKSFKFYEFLSTY